MIAQRPAEEAPCVRGVAEALPLADGSVDAALAVLTIHHWSDLAAGVAELRRVARRRIVVLTWEQADPAFLTDGLTRLADDIGSGRWRERHADLLELDALDAGYRLVVTDID